MQTTTAPVTRTGLEAQEAPVSFSTTTAPVTLASTMLGDVVCSDGIVYILTRCCKASAKGTERGVVCRACHALQADEAGWASLADDELGVASLAGLLRPSIEQFAEPMAARIFMSARGLETVCRDCGAHAPHAGHETDPGRLEDRVCNYGLADHRADCPQA